MFNNNKINENGFPKTINGGESYCNSHAYLTNGSGAVTEEEVPFTNTQEPIDISEIQNKNVVTTVFDSVEFEVPTNEDQKYGESKVSIEEDEIVLQIGNNG